MNMSYCGAEYQCQCPPSSLIECPLTLEPEAYRQIKKNLGPVIRQRLRELLKKALTIESAIEAAHTIDLLKLLNESRVQSVKENNVQHCAADFQCQCSPSACECPLTLEPEAFKLLKNNLGPVIRQRLMELREKTRTVESAIEMADPTINMLKLLRESNSEFNAVRENMLNGAQQLRDASDKLGNEMHNVY
ncbi:hypothetical protein RHSIM_Rhsim05G0208400 [Rhododendron simsii]|uniref:Uncharacterized protein n=1 Tax=Rhododendron simsii TaxID=118357 RepID=A0A834H120_RHOSS|nr:hypothetical protein RHSIM_Rhsim05G0208400 [Rhododendron simsii]